MRARSFHLALVILCVALLPNTYADLALTSNGAPLAVILTKPSPAGYVQLAAQELQSHIQQMAGATLPIDVVGTEANYPGRVFIYVGASTATTAAGINLNAYELEYYSIQTIGNNLYIVGRDGGTDAWYDLTDCQPGTLLGVYHFLGEILGVRWLWPGTSGTSVPARATITVPPLSLTTGPALVQRKYRTPRVGLYLANDATYGTTAVPVLPTDAARKQQLAYDDLLWLRRMRMGSRKKPGFGHYFTNWWTLYGATHPEYFAVLPAGKSQPDPATDRTKQHVSGSAVWDQRIAEWTASGSGTSVNICPTDSRSFCLCNSCLAWDRPSQSPDVIFSDSSARLSDRYARFYYEIATRVKAINPSATVYGYAYDGYRYAPLEATVPDNVALAYVPGAPSAVLPSAIADTESDVLGWIAHGCTQMYLRPNWMLSGHCGPFWPTRRLGNHLRTMLLSGNIKGFDSDSSCSSYASFGLYYYMVCRLLADPTLTPDAIQDEYCSAFGAAAARVRDYLNYWEFFINNQADAGNTDILAWSGCVPAYRVTYSDSVFEGALQILDAAYATLAPTDTAIRARLDFLRLGCLHGRMTAKAISLVDPSLSLAANPAAEIAMRQLLAQRDQMAESFAVWREWMIDRESNVTGMQAYWTQILANPLGNNGSNVGAYAMVNGEVTIEAENYTSAAAGTGTATGITWQPVSVANAVGSCMQALPNTGVDTQNSNFGPRLDYRIDFRAAGTYYAYLRLPFTNTSDDAVNVGLDGVGVSSNINNTSGSFRWRLANSAGFPVVLNVTTPGIHTFNIWMREDGCVVDRIYITTSSTLPFAVTATGNAESSRRPAAGEHVLKVIGGTGDGTYGADSLVPIKAAAAKAGYVFDQWTGVPASSFVSATSASTYFDMTTTDAIITATYKIDPAADTDGDGIADAWEMARFGGLNVASASSDFDHDGTSDAAEALADTNPKDAASRFAIKAINRSATGGLTITWPGAVGKTYRIEAKSDLSDAAWLPLVAGVPGMQPDCVYDLPITATARFFRVVLE